MVHFQDLPPKYEYYFRCHSPKESRSTHRRVESERKKKERKKNKLRVFAPVHSLKTKLWFSSLIEGKGKTEGNDQEKDHPWRKIRLTKYPSAEDIVLPHYRISIFSSISLTNMQWNFKPILFTQFIARSILPLFLAPCFRTQHEFDAALHWLHRSF